MESRDNKAYANGAQEPILMDMITLITITAVMGAFGLMSVKYGTDSRASHSILS